MVHLRIRVAINSQLPIPVSTSLCYIFRGAPRTPRCFFFPRGELPDCLTTACQQLILCQIERRRLLSSSADIPFYWVVVCYYSLLSFSANNVGCHTLLSSSGVIIICPNKSGVAICCHHLLALYVNIIRLYLLSSTSAVFV